MGSGGLGLMIGVVALSVSVTAQAQEVSRSPDVIPADEVRQRPKGYHLETRPRRGAIIGGAITTGIGALMVVAGLQQRAQSRSSDVEQSPGAGGELFLIPGAICLGIGVPMLAYGLLSPREVYVRDSPITVSVAVSPKGRAGVLALSLEL